MKRRVTALAVGVLTLSACAGSDDAGGPDVTFATTPPPDETTSDTTASDSAPAATAPADTSPDAAPGESPPATTVFVPGDDVDVPRTAPGDTVADTTSTVLPVGPLPTPSLVLVDAGEFDSPVEVTQRPGDSRTFVVEQGGRIHAIDDLSSTVVLDITELTETNGEQGLLGLAFHPQLEFAYVNYIDGNGDSVIAEYPVDPSSAVLDAANAREVLVVEQPFGNHNGGELAFGPDGLLYVGFGDGGSADDPQRTALDVSNPLGKILRIDPLGAADLPFTVPPDNPFVGSDGADPRIWSVGLRNPWKFSFDEATGDLWIADVGQDAFEEVNVARATAGVGAGRGVSFGWSAFEGDARFNDDQPADGHTPPLFTYPHDDGNCSISGGAVARSAAAGDLVGWYVYGDFCTGTIWGYDTTSPPDAPVIVELAQLGNLVAVAIGADGDLFAVSNAGTVARLSAD